MFSYRNYIIYFKFPFYQQSVPDLPHNMHYYQLWIFLLHKGEQNNPCARFQKPMALLKDSPDSFMLTEMKFILSVTKIKSNFWWLNFWIKPSKRNGRYVRVLAGLSHPNRRSLWHVATTLDFFSMHIYSFETLYFQR